jgi:hypothetical protein
MRLGVDLELGLIRADDLFAAVGALGRVSFLFLYSFSNGYHPATASQAPRT